MIDAARFGTQLDRLGDLVPITCYGIKLVPIRLNGSFTRVRRVTGGFDQFVDVLSFLLKKAMGFHFVAIDEAIGRTNVRTPVPNEPPQCRLLFEKKKKSNYKHTSTYTH